MRNLILSALILASAFQTAVGQIVEGQWTYIVEDGGATITASTATGAVTIPSVLGGYAVKKVGGSIFGDENEKFSIISSVGSIIIPNSVSSIGDVAFAGLPNLTSVTIGNSVKSIGASAFSRCTRLTNITIPNSVTSLGAYAFSGCWALTSITLGSSVANIGESTFSDCLSLSSIIIPNSVTSVGMYAFVNCSSLTGTLTIPNSVTSIGDYAFAGCSGLTGTLTIPNSVTSIGFGAFQGCSGLTTFTAPDKFISQVAYFGINGQVATDYLVNALANNDAFVTAVANKIKATSGNFGLATQSGVTGSISSVINEGRVAGIASVTASPNTWSLFTTSQIQNMALGDLVLTKNVGGTFTLNYDIEQSADLQTWTTYAPLSLPLTGLPTDKAFVRIKAKK